MRNLILLSIALSLVGCTVSEAAPRTAEAKDALVKKGAKLVAIGGCGDCHTPKKFDPELKLPLPDLSRMLSGHTENTPDPASDLAEGDMAIIGGDLTSFKLQIGVAYAANLTPDKMTGLGNWDEALFLKALRTGRHLGAGRPILPPMPWFELGRQSDEDLKAIFAYLQSIPAVHNHVPNAKVQTESLRELGKSYDLLLERMRTAPPAASGR